MKIVVTGASGFVGSKLCQVLSLAGHTVIPVSVRGGDVPPSIADCDAIIHLAGAPIFHRWSKSYKEIICDSRIKTAQAIYNFLATSEKKPSVFISASAVGFYPDGGESPLDEASPPGDSFLSSVCQKWEKITASFSSLGMRTVSVRTSLVLDLEGGALAKMVPLFKWGLGGNLGSGSQWMPWIHRDDLIQVYLLALVDPAVVGPINGVSPGSIRNSSFTRALGKFVKRPTFFSIPAFVLRLILGEFAEVLLVSQKVIPQKLERLKFTFAYPSIEKVFHI